MRVKVKGNSHKDIKVTFYITSEEEAHIFHDYVAINICSEPNNFIGHIFNPIKYGQFSRTYEITTPPRPSGDSE